MTVAEPTDDQCDSRTKLGDGYACWYPSMGGYVGKAIVIPDGDCVNVYVWHNGQFPFHDGELLPGEHPPSPVFLHHCSGQQFVEFGRFLIQGSGGS